MSEAIAGVEVSHPAEAGRGNGGTNGEEQRGGGSVICESPPPAEQPAREEVIEPRARLLQLAAELMRSRNRRTVIEYLRLRRAM